MEVLYRVHPVVLCPYCRGRHLGVAMSARTEYGNIARGAFDDSGNWIPGVVRASCWMVGEIFLPIPEDLFRNPYSERGD